MSDWREIFSQDRHEHTSLEEAFSKWDLLSGGRTRNVDIIWFPKPISELSDMRNKLRVAYEQQLKNKDKTGEEFFVENDVAEELVERGAFTRPGTNANKVVEEYEEETTADKPHISSFRMQNRLFRFLGWTMRRVGYQNQYIVTTRGIQMTKFNGAFPDTIGALSERDVVLTSLLNFGVFSVNDNVNQWDTRFKQRIVVNLLRVTAEYGYISNNELVVTAFALKNERDAQEVQNMVERLHRLHESRITMVDAFKEVNVDPYDSSAVNNAYDGPKVLLSLCRQVELLSPKTFSTQSTPFGDLRGLYSKMHEDDSEIKEPRVVNVISELGNKALVTESKKSVIWFDELK